MGSAPSVPVPDANSINASQFGYNTLSAEEQAALNQTGQTTPFGSLTYTPTGVGPGGVPTYNATTQLSPQEQYLLSTGQVTQGEAATQGANLLGAVNYGSAPDIGSMTSGLIGQQLSAETSALHPYFSQQLEGLQSQLANQGLTPTDPAYQVAMNNLMQSQNQSITGFLAQQEPQAFGQAMSEYNLPLDTATKLFGVGVPANLSQNLINTPQGSVQTVNAAAAAGAQNQAAIANAQLQQQQYSGMLNGIASLGSAFLA